MDPFIVQLTELSRTHLTRSKWVFVPSHALGHTIGERIALAGTNWLNLRFVTPLDIALRMGAPFLVERGIDPTEDGLGPALIMRLLLDLPQEGGYFRPLADQPTMAQAIDATVRELRMAGVTSDGLNAEAFESPAKHAELRALLHAYESFLAANNRGDMATVYQEALRHPEWCPIQPEDCWTEWPDVVWPPLQRRIIDAMPGERMPPRAFELPGTRAPRRLDPSRAERAVPDASSHPLAFLMGSDRDAVSGRDASGAATREPGSAPIAIFHAGGRDAEVEEVFRRILHSGAALDEIEIACASEAHLALVWEKALRHGWPITLASGISATHTRPGRALIGFCDWIETDFSAGHLRRLLQSGDVALDARASGVTAGQAARTLVRAEAGWGRATYGLAFGALRRSHEARAADPDRSDDERADASARATQTSAVAAWIETIIASVPEPAGDGAVPLQPVVTAAIDFLECAAARTSQLDHRAASSLTAHLGELRALGAFSCPLTEALRFVRERVQSLQVAPARSRAGHLHACALAHVGVAGRPRLFVVGLEEGGVFPTASEDPVLLDAERRAISPTLRCSGDRIDEAVYSALARLATWHAAPAAAAPTPSVTFSFSCRDTREFRDTYASWLVLQAFRLEQREGTLTYHDLKAALGEPASSVPARRDEALAPGAWWLRSVVGARDEGVRAVEATFTGIARGRAAADERASVRFTEFDGHVPDAGVVLDPCAPQNAFSVTELEGAAGCPFRLFLKRGLGLRAVDGRERDRDVWLDPLTRGAELHDIYAALLRRCRDATRRATLQEDRDWLRTLAQSRLTALHREMPAATDEILARESRDFLADLDLFLEAESENSTTTPLGFEVSFGRPLGDEVEALARAAPVEINLGSGLVFRIAGRIDRIDQVGPAAFEVLDYKTGGYWRDNWLGVFDGGRRLQHALYGLAAVELLRQRCTNPTVTAGVYYFSSHRGRQERVRIAHPTPREMAAVLGDLRDIIAAGAFVHSPDKNACRYCDFIATCGPAATTQAKGKLADAQLTVYRRLTAHV